MTTWVMMMATTRGVTMAMTSELPQAASQKRTAPMCEASYLPPYAVQRRPNVGALAMELMNSSDFSMPCGTVHF